MQLSWTEPRFRLDRHRALGMAVREWRPSPSLAAGGCTLLYLHGLGESALCFERLLAEPRLAAYRQVAPDLIGYGKSDWAEEPFDVAAHASKLGQLIEQFELERVVLIGHSMGGVIGTRVAADDPARIAGLVNIEGNISPADCGQSAFAHGYDLTDFLDHGYAEMLDELFVSAGDGEQQESHQVARAYGASLQMCDPRTFHRNSIDLVEMSASETLADAQAALDLPSIYIRGVPRGGGEYSLALLESAGIETHAISAAGHWPYLDRHDEVVTIVSDFLDRQECGPDVS